MRISELGINLIRKYEGLSLTSYYCPSGKLTIGIGHTGSDVKKGMIISEPKALNLFLNDLNYRCYPFISRAIKINLTQRQFDVLCSFCFNVGGGAFMTSTLVKIINNWKLPGRKALIRYNFMLWTRGANGKQLPGLVKRRKEEADLFLMEVK